jgi:hypothetical protein
LARKEGIVKTHTVTVREGENLGPVDWDYDFEQHDWDHGGGTKPLCVQEGKKVLQQLVAADGGRVWLYDQWRDVLDFGMYDGWPFWRPVPSVCVATFVGPEWHWFGSLRGFKPPAHQDAAEDPDTQT